MHHHSISLSDFPSVWIDIFHSQLDEDKKEDSLRLRKHDPRLDEPSKEIVHSIAWNDLPRQEAINNIAKILHSPLFPNVLAGDFNFLDNIIRTQDIKFTEIDEAHRRFITKPFLDRIREGIQNIFSLKN